MENHVSFSSQFFYGNKVYSAQKTIESAMSVRSFRKIGQGVWLGHCLKDKVRLAVNLT